MAGLPLLERMAFWASDALNVVGVVLLVLPWVWPWWRTKAARCFKCRYDLTGLKEGDGGGPLCPECGKVTRTRHLHRRPGRRACVVWAMVCGVVSYGLVAQREVRDRGWPAAIPSEVLVMVWPVDVVGWCRYPFVEERDPVLRKLVGRLQRRTSRFEPMPGSPINDRSAEARWWGKVSPSMPDWLANWWLDRALATLNAGPDPLETPPAMGQVRVARVYDWAIEAPLRYAEQLDSTQQDENGELLRWSLSRFCDIDEESLELLPMDERLEKYKSNEEFEKAVAEGVLFDSKPVGLGKRTLTAAVGSRVLIYATGDEHASFQRWLKRWERLASEGGEW